MILVVNADDAGVDPGRNRGILRAAKEGLVRSASLLVGFGAAEAFVEQARRLESLGIGLHANFTEGLPLVKGHRSLVGESGQFLGKMELMRRGAAGLVDKREARRELEAQWGAMKRLGLEPTHVDGHNHAHLCPGIAEAVLEAIPARTWVRLSTSRPLESARSQDFELPPNPYESPEVLSAVLRKLARRAWRLGWDQFRTPKYFEGLSLPPGYRVEALMALLAAMPLGDKDVVELMTHPGEVDASSVPFSSSNDRTREVEALTDARVLSLVKERGLRLSSFGALP